MKPDLMVKKVELQTMAPFFYFSRPLEDTLEFSVK